MSEIEILKKQRNFAIKASIVSMVIAVFLGYLWSQESLCTDLVEGTVISSLERIEEKSPDYISTQYTYDYGNETYEGCQVTYIQYEKGDVIDVYVNPNRPSKSVAESLQHTEFKEIAFETILLGAFLIWFVVIAIKRSIRIKKLYRS